MAIQKRGRESWRIIIYNGRDSKGKNICFTKTIHGSRKKAEDTEKIMAAEIIKSQLSQNTIKRMTLHEYFDYWIENYARHRLAPRTIDLYTYEFRRIDAAIGHKPLDKIESHHILRFYRELRACSRLDGRKGGLSATSIRKYHTLLHLLFEKGVQWNMLYKNPINSIDPPSYRYKNVKTILDHEQLEKFLTLLKDEPTKHQLWSLLGISLGLRRGEIFGLQWRHIDFEKRTIRIEQCSQSKSGGGVIIGPTKTKQMRILSVPDSLIELLRKYQSLKLRRPLRPVNPNKIKASA